jgi:hypothetical protein
MDALPPKDLSALFVHPGRTLERCIYGLLGAAGVLDRGGVPSFFPRLRGAPYVRRLLQGRERVWTRPLQPGGCL